MNNPSASATLLSVKVSPTVKQSVIIVVSKKVAKTAVARNRIRRRIRAVVTEYAKTHDISRSAIKIYTHTPIAGASFQAIRCQVLSALKSTH
jgi:ribonuclease P protein component